MRTIVVGKTHQLANGMLTGEVWFRFPVPSGREAIYANASYQPQAPLSGDASIDDAERAALAAGAYVEQYHAPQQQLSTAQGNPGLEAQLLGFYQAELAGWVATENDRLRYWGSSFDPAASAGAGVWTIKSA